MPIRLTQTPTTSRFPRTTWHLSVQQRAPKLWQGQARPDQLDDAAESSGEPGGSASGDFSGLIGGGFFFLWGWGWKAAPRAGGDAPEEGRGQKGDRRGGGGGGGGGG